MKHFMIKYRRKEVPAEQWHKDITNFIAALNEDPAVKGQISYRCMKIGNSDDYYHIAGAANEAATKALQQTTFFPAYTARTKEVSGGEVEVLPLEIIAETAFRS
jgi:hypothetical protein